MFLLELFRLGESFVSNTWPVDQQPSEEEPNTDNVEKVVLKKNRHDAVASGENTCTSEDDEEDVSSSVTITSPRVSEHPPTQTVEINKPPIGKIIENKDRYIAIILGMCENKIMRKTQHFEY